MPKASVQSVKTSRRFGRNPSRRRLDWPQAWIAFIREGGTASKDPKAFASWKERFKQLDSGGNDHDTILYCFFGKQRRPGWSRKIHASWHSVD
jgi:hypothetical protein